MRTLTVLMAIFTLLILAGCTIGQAPTQPPQLRFGATPVQRLGIINQQPLSDCVDSDNTLSYKEDSYYTAGFVITSLDTDNDSCKGGRLIEYFCEFGHKKHELFTCPHGCFDGACLIYPETEPTTAPVVP